MEASKNVSKVVVVVVVIWRALLLVNPSLLYFSVGFMLWLHAFSRIFLPVIVFIKK
jgi:hypothetical protein